MRCQYWPTRSVNDHVTPSPTPGKVKRLADAQINADLSRLSAKVSCRFIVYTLVVSKCNEQMISMRSLVLLSIASRDCLSHRFSQLAM